MLEKEPRHFAPVSENEISPEDISKWEQGAAEFLAFQESIRGEHGILDFQIPLVQAVFLKEKPLALLQSELDEKTRKELESHGLRARGRYVYDPIQIQQVLEAYPNVFEGWGSSADQVIDRLRASRLQEASQQRGLLLGIPLESVNSYVEYEKYRADRVIVELFKLLDQNSADQEYLLNEYFSEKRFGNDKILNFIESKFKEYHEQLGLAQEEIPTLVDEVRKVLAAEAVSVHGINWMDYAPSKQSKEKQKRLKQAFEKSGILEESK